MKRIKEKQMNECRRGREEEEGDKEDRNYRAGKEEKLANETKMR